MIPQIWAGFQALAGRLLAVPASHTLRTLRAIQLLAGILDFACALVLHPDILSVLATGLPQVTMVRVGHVVGAADGIGSQRTIRRALTQTFAVFGNDARRAPGAVDLLAGFRVITGEI